jgi:hypothetical protein
MPDMPPFLFSLLDIPLRKRHDGQAEQGGSFGRSPSLSVSGGDNAHFFGSSDGRVWKVLHDKFHLPMLSAR